MEDYGWAVVYSLAPTVLIGLLFWFIMRALIRADRNERKAYAEIESEERARLAGESAELSSRD
jgi:flagellar biosynthesis/type III secretory pathway M-ring protein FliF/YscJ